VPRQYAFDATPRHAAVLSREEAEQLQVDIKRDRRRPDGAGIDAL